MIHIIKSKKEFNWKNKKKWHMNEKNDKNNLRHKLSEITDKAISILKNDTNLTIKVDWSKETLGELIFIIGMSSLALTFMIIFMILDDIIGGFICLIIILIFTLPLIPSFFRNYKKITEWNFNTQLTEITYSQVLLRNKLLEQLNFSYIKYIYYQVSWDEYILSFFLDSSKEVLICGMSSKKDCEDLGILIANFINKPLYYRHPHNDGSNFIFDPKIDENNSPQKESKTLM